MKKRKCLFSQKKCRGVTLIELLIVLTIIAILALAVVPRLVGSTEQARRTRALQDVKSGLASAIKLYEVHNGHYPPNLDALIKKPSGAPNWHGPYLEDAGSVPLDPWGHPYQYKCPGGKNPHSYDLFSFGADGKAGGEGNAEDIGNW